MGTCSKYVSIVEPFLELRELDEVVLGATPMFHFSSLSYGSHVVLVRSWSSGRWLRRYDLARPQRLAHYVSRNTRARLVRRRSVTSTLAASVPALECEVASLGMAVILVPRTDLGL